MGYHRTDHGAQPDADTIVTAPEHQRDTSRERTTNLIGTRLGGYDVQVLIGSGGMASVYRAFDPNLQRLVAIKVLSVSVAAQPGYQDRFLQEARLIATLRHPYIVQVYDLDEQDDATYIVQELLPGPTLEAWMADRAARGEPPKPAEILTIITQLASALQWGKPLNGVDTS
jgi:serine/threonine-protein kinase